MKKEISEWSSGSFRNEIQIFGIRFLQPGWKLEIIFKSITLHSFESVIGLCMLSKGMERKHLECKLGPGWSLMSGRLYRCVSAQLPIAGMTLQYHHCILSSSGARGGIPVFCCLVPGSHKCLDSQSAV